MYKIIFVSRKAEKTYRRLRESDPRILAEIDEALEQLERNPKEMVLMRKATIRKMKGKYKGKYRIKTPFGYRIVYEIAEKQLLVKIYKIDTRESIGY